MLGWVMILFWDLTSLCASEKVELHCLRQQTSCQHRVMFLTPGRRCQRQGWLSGHFGMKHFKKPRRKVHRSLSRAWRFDFLRSLWRLIGGLVASQHALEASCCCVLLLIWLPPVVMSDNCLMMLLCDSVLVFAAIVCPFWKLRNIFPCKSPAWMAFRLQSTWLSRAVFAGSKSADWSEDKKSRVSYHHRHNTNETRFVGICIEVASRRRGSTPWYITCHSHMVLLRMRVHSLQTVGELISAIKTAARAEDLNMMLAFNAEVRCGCP